jgi:AcrR family transcriptional regulator
MTTSSVLITSPAGPGTRERLLEAASSLFSEQGYAATGTRAIAARAVCNVALISHYFGSKDAFGVALLVTVSAGGLASCASTTRTERTGAIVWRECGDIECATLSVPLDRTHPEGRRIRLALRDHDVLVAVTPPSPRITQGLQLGAGACAVGRKVNGKESIFGAPCVSATYGVQIRLGR